MPRKLAADVSELLYRAEVDSPNSPAKAEQRNKPASRPEQPAGRVYNGDPQAKTPGYAVRPANRKASPRKRRSTFNIVAVLFLAAIAIVVYIGNILTVNQLAVEVHQLQSQYDKKMNENKILQSVIDKKSNRDRIVEIAEKELGLVSKGGQVGSFTVDADKLEKFKDK